ncbi:MAG: DNA polymerase III subunit beta [Deltaproteobacteria bacterium]|nr:DNA polymerase III subunit beta [Deltaproteobacteria bacterium]
MKLTCLQENLSRGLNIVGKAVSTRSTLPVLGNVLLATDQSRLKLAATNLELGINCWIGARIEEKGAITLPARTLVDMVNAFTAEKVSMELNVRSKSLRLTCGRSEANIKGIDAEEFPLIPESEPDGVEIPSGAFGEMITKTAFAAATDESRPILTGVLVKFDGERVTMAAADGFRLSVAYSRLGSPVDEPFTLIIPANSLKELNRICGDQEQPIRLTLPAGRGQVIFAIKDVDLVSQLIDGAFPDYDQIIPTSHATRTVVATSEMLAACKAADIIAREAAHTARIRILPDDELTPGHMVVAAMSAETGDNETEIDALVDGDPVEVAFNVRYLNEVLSVIETPQVAVETVSESNPGVIRPVGNDDFVHVIMPMHLGR